ncbi:cardiolipin-specific phospholipase [Kwoniella heveanensis BCC8398]|uniref:Cardiolipin-specific phospholipase n=1 Tax=Kwoniella heveanensis BCC8398 TaxID=1296120 RepID=A0A1B9H1X3_9TREE|nr:cardiolipin-specific phospholipase [Kwoniella heveanensis BCC8398]
MTTTPQPAHADTAVLVSPTRPGSAPPLRTETPPPPPSRAIPTDFRSSLSAWWSTSSYKEARLAEERLLRRMASFEPTPPSTLTESKGWFGLSRGTHNSAAASRADGAMPAMTAEQANMDDSEIGQIKEPISIKGTGLQATLRNVFIPTPNPADAPQHPADPRESSSSAASSSTDLSSAASASTSTHVKKHHCKHHKDKDGKLVDYINTLEVTSPENKQSKEAVVVLHGYAAALGFFFRNWESISVSSAATGRRTFFLDWLGMGLSSRPSPSLLASSANTPVPSRVARAEHFFLSSLESWRASVGVEKMVLVGHSLGGYLASAYAVRYPERVSGLVLVSPAGVPHGPEYVRYPLTAELGSRASQERRNEITSPPESPSELEDATNAADAEINSGGRAHEAKGEAKNWQKDSSMLRKGMMKFFVWGWERGLSPFMFLRGAGPLGPLWVGKYSARRFASQTEEDVRDLHAYIYGTSIMKGSGEYCISHILAPGAYARIPIVDRISRLKVPVTFMYGDNDWMDVEGGRASVEALKEAGNSNATCHVVPKAGHHLYLDNPEFTNKLLDHTIKAVPKLA